MHKKQYRLLIVILVRIVTVISVDIVSMNIQISRNLDVNVSLRGTVENTVKKVTFYTVRINHVSFAIEHIVRMVENATKHRRRRQVNAAARTNLKENVVKYHVTHVIDVRMVPSVK